MQQKRESIKNKAAKIKENDEYEAYENEESEYESRPLTKLFESLRIAQNVSDPLHISNKLFFNKKDLFDFLATQSKEHKRVPNFAFFESSLTRPLRKKQLKAILDLCNISLYENKSRKKFKENLRFVSKANPKFAVLILEKQSGEILTLISINDDETNSYDLSLEIREKFKKISAYPQAKWSNDDVFCLLHDSFRTRYSDKANIELYVGSIESFNKIITQKLQKSEKKHIIFGYISRWDTSLINGSTEHFKKLMLDLGQYFDIDLLRIASHSDSDFLRYSILLKDTKDTLEVLFLLDEYDNDGQAYENNYFFDPYLTLLNELGGAEEDEITIAEYCGVNVIKADEDFTDSKVNEGYEGEEQDLPDNVLRIETLDSSEESIEIIFPKDTPQSRIDTIMNKIQTKEKFDEQDIAFLNSLGNERNKDSTKDKKEAYNMLFEAIMSPNFDLFEEALRQGADANGIVSKKQAKSDLARQNDLCEAGTSHYAMAVSKILDHIALDDEDFSEAALKEECKDAFKILLSMRDLKPCDEALRDTKELLEDTFGDWWYQAYKEADEFGFKGDLDEEALHTWLRNHKPLAYFEVLGKELGLDLELSWE